jgi:hypothetical protein
MVSKIQLTANASNVTDVLVQIEIFDHDLKRVVKEWLTVNETKTYLVEAGLVGVRASLPSGAIVDQTVRVEPNQTEFCYLNLNMVSPHETQQWAYLTQSIPAAGIRVLSNPLFEGIWLRLWRRTINGMTAKWEVVPLPVTDSSQASWDEEGVTYRFKAPDQGLYALQVGGPKIPWKNVAIPSTYEVMVLVRPAPEPTASVHPLDIVVSSGDSVMESLLTLMQRGDIAGAQELNKHSGFAERLLFEKQVNTDAAAIGGYYLLRMRDLNRLHNWANNLANLFQWMADGPVIHAWQIILGFKEDVRPRPDQLVQARNRLLEAVSRGFPIYTEGMRLLRDGLLYLDRRAESKDTQITDALNQISKYADVVDWTMTNTSFMGKSPDAPSAKPRKGTPREKGSLIYVFDVPLKEVLRVSKLTPDDTLIATMSGREIESQITSKGEIKLDDGSLFTSMGAAQQHIIGDSRNSLNNWRAHSVELGDAIDNLRIQATSD